MRIKLPDNFGGLSIEGVPISLAPDKDGCVNVGDGVAQALITHGGKLAPDVTEERARIEAEILTHDEAIADLTARRPKAK